MTDQDYIKAAVKLADGWEWSGLILETDEDRFHEPLSDAALDALVAQLARQTYEKWRDIGKTPEFVYQIDPMDTIKEIIDDGWLDES